MKVNESINSQKIKKTEIKNNKNIQNNEQLMI